MTEQLSKEELLELRAALLQRENLRLQLEISERDLRAIQDRLTAKFGSDAIIRTDTGVVSRQANGEVSQ